MMRRRRSTSPTSFGTGPLATNQRFHSRCERSPATGVHVKDETFFNCGQPYCSFVTRPPCMCASSSGGKVLGAPSYHYRPAHHYRALPSHFATINSDYRWLALVLFASSSLPVAPHWRASACLPACGGDALSSEDHHPSQVPLSVHACSGRSALCRAGCRNCTITWPVPVRPARPRCATCPLHTTK